MEGPTRPGRRVIAFALGLRAVGIPWLAGVGTVFAAADQVDQARVLLRSVVSRAAFRQILGVGFDLPVTIVPLP